MDRRLLFFFYEHHRQNKEENILIQTEMRDHRKKELKQKRQIEL